MSYARWSNSNWYAFDNINGKFSLWHVGIGDNPDFIYEILRDHQTDGTLDQMLRAAFPGVDDDDVAEAIKIIGWVLEDIV